MKTFQADLCNHRVYCLLSPMSVVHNPLDWLFMFKDGDVSGTFSMKKSAICHFQTSLLSYWRLPILMEIDKTLR